MLRSTIRNRVVVGLAALATAALVLVGAAPASAHGGDIQLDLNQDGTGRIMVTATYVEDGHPVEVIMDPVVTAMSIDGTIIGPISLISASDLGVSTWSTAEPLLEAGVWTVTVATTNPAVATLTEDVEVTIVDTTEPEPQPVEEAASGMPWWLFAILGAGLLLLVALVIVALRLRARRASASPN